jgi:hypothetical protein
LLEGSTYHCPLNGDDAAAVIVNNNAAAIARRLRIVRDFSDIRPPGRG